MSGTVAPSAPFLDSGESRNYRVRRRGGNQAWDKPNRNIPLAHIPRLARFWDQLRYTCGRESEAGRCVPVYLSAQGDSRIVPAVAFVLGGPSVGDAVWTQVVVSRLAFVRGMLVRGFPPSRE